MSVSFLTLSVNNYFNLLLKGKMYMLENLVHKINKSEMNSKGEIPPSD